VGSPEVIIRHAAAVDAGALSDLAARTFRQAFAADNRPEDITLHIERSYGPALQRSEVGDATIRTLLAEIDGQLSAFAQVRSSRPPACVRLPSPVELWRFYVDASWIGRGVAQRLMAAAYADASALGGQTLWLGVWERNQRAIAFYRKCGFEDYGTQVFCVGEDVQTDRIMARGLAAGHALGDAGDLG
jgi:ribosomal protein S18 acetylase RimI-like enzyme